MHWKSAGQWCRRLCAASMVLCVSSLADATEPLPFEPPPADISAQNRLLLQQADQLYQSGASVESIEVLRGLLSRLSGPEVETVNEVVQVGGVQRAGTLRVRRFISVPRWVSDRLARVIEASGEVSKREGAEGTSGPPTQIAEPVIASFVLEGADSAWREELREADVCLEQGWTLRAQAALQRIDGKLQFSVKSVLPVVDKLDGVPADSGVLPAEGASEYVVTGSFSWPLVPLTGTTDEVAAKIDAELVGLVQSLEEKSERLSVQVFRRLAIASQLTPALVEPQRVRSLLVRIRNLTAADMHAELDKLIGALPSGRGGESERGELGSVAKPAPLNWNTNWPNWNVRLARYTSTSDQTPASRPRVAEVEGGSLPYRPAIWRDVVFLNELNQVRAFDLSTGRGWPDDQPLADSGLRPIQLTVRDRGVVGVPRGEVQVYEDCLYARIGGAITGWAPTTELTFGSSIVGIDLAATRRSGRPVSLPGFPIRLSDKEFSGCQFEGPPLPSGDCLLVPIAERSNVGLRRSVAAFDRWSGDLVWRSAPLGAGTVAGTEQAHHVAHQCLTLSGGYLYCLTNLGAVACLDPTSGQIQWLSQYSRPDRQRQVAESPDRYLYRQSNPCFVHGGLVYCAPTDCGEIFALDAISGDLLWSTVATDAPDAVFLLGVVGDSLCVSGDRLVWIDRRTGQIQARFPGATTPGISNSLPTPRGLGRGTIHDGYVYYPVAGEILVFDAKPLGGVPRRGIPVPSVKIRIKMDSRGVVGGNLFIHNGKLIYTSPSRLMVFE